MEHNPEYYLLEVFKQHFPGFVLNGTPQPLSGGLLNCVWRAPGSTASIPPSVVIKWTPPFIASLPDVPLDPARIVIEAKAMKLFGSGGLFNQLSSENIRPPQLYFDDEHQFWLVMEDLGNWPDLGMWLHDPLHTEEAAIVVGELLGSFIGALHLESFRRPELAREFNNQSIQRTRLEFQYGNIQGYASRVGLSAAELLGHKAVEYGQKLQGRGTNLIMGDLWTRSILVTGSGLRLIDWEFAHYGRASQDIGHLAAHLWMHAHRAPAPKTAALARIVLNTFLMTYRSALGPDFNKLFGLEATAESSIHFGSEVLTRIAGAFQKDYLYQGLAHDGSIVQEAAQVAEKHILSPMDVNTFDVLR